MTRRTPVIFGLIVALVGGCGTSRDTPTTGPWSSVDGQTGIGMTTVDLDKYPPGVPADAEFTFFGRAGRTFAVREKPIDEPGTLYVYDDTAGRLAVEQAVSPKSPGVRSNIDPEHEFRGFFLPDRLKRRTPSSGPAGLRP